MIHTLGALVIKYLLELKQDCRIKTIDYSGNIDCQSTKIP